MRLALSCLLLGSALLGCQTTGKPVVDKAATAASLDTGLWPASTTTLRTTSATIYLRNLDTRIDSYRQRLGGNEPAGLRASLASALYHRFKIRGQLDDAEQALQLLVEDAQPPTDAGKLLHATLLSGLHRFDEARALLGTIAPAPATQAAVQSLRWDIDVATGDYAALADEFALSPQLVGDFYALAHRADLRVLLGDLATAEQHLRAAQSLYADVNPVAIAWLHTQMGIAFLRFGRIEDAQRFFAAAVARLPGYALAEEHLAETEFLLGDLRAAQARYQRVIEQTGDPEFMAALAEVEQALGDEAAARDWRGRAIQGYEQRLRRHPAAFAQHAAEFFLATGDAHRALQLARDNRSLRADVGSEILLARAATAAHEHATACSALARIEALPVRPPELAELQPVRSYCD